MVGQAVGRMGVGAIERVIVQVLISAVVYVSGAARTLVRWVG